MTQSKSTTMQFLDKLIINGFVDIPSPKIRGRIYSILKEKNIQWTSEIIGYTVGKRSLNRYIISRKIGWDLGRIVKWIGQKRIRPEDLEQACSQLVGTPYSNFDNVKKIFDENMSNTERYNIIQENWGRELELDYIKYTPFDLCYLRKTIVRITIS